jgi:hypothetical protein
LTLELGFEQWYLDSLPIEVKNEAIELLSFIESSINNLLESQIVDKHTAQYLIPMGYKVPMWVSGDLPALVYFVEQRSSASVHHTLRVKAQSMGEMIADMYDMPVYIDYTNLGFNPKRGLQDIVAK